MEALVKKLEKEYQDKIAEYKKKIKEIKKRAKKK